MNTNFISNLAGWLPSRTTNLFQYHHKTTLALSAFALSAFILYPWANQNYHEYIALGPGGMPHNLLGWGIATAIKPVEGETLSTEMYDEDSDKSNWLSGGDGETEVPRRQGSRPKTGWHCIPHRQIDQIPMDDVKELLNREFRTIAEANTHLVEVRTSLFEKIGDSLSIHSTIPSPHPVAQSALREIAHVHTMKDSSMHVVLSPQDCKLVIEQGWGERHPISGRVFLPKEYLFIYAPLTAEDVRIHGLIMRAAIKYMTGRGDVL